VIQVTDSARIEWPLRDGVSASTMVLPHSPEAEFHPSLLLFLEQTMKQTRGLDWENRLKNGLVIDSTGQALAVDAPYLAGQRIYYWRDAGAEPRIPFEEQIIYQDEHLLVADKPHYLPVAPTGRYVQETLLVRLKKRTGIADLVPIHRIDRDTAGLVMFCIRRQDRDAYAALFRQRLVRKVYECIAPVSSALQFPLIKLSRIEESPHSFMQMAEVEGAPNSETRIEQIETCGDWARYQLHPLTGKRHQLRAHMHALGLPIQGDGIYPVLTPEPAIGAQPDYSRPMKLLAQELEFIDPITGQQRRFETALALEF
jgi:tRNA pseudouridine32 synthase / 23S rRNA pseudouridine746 synthase